MVRRVLCLIPLLFCFCFEGPTGPAGDPGPGKMQSVNGIIAASMYDSSSGNFRIPLVYPQSDNVLIDVYVRQDSRFAWYLPAVWLDMRNMDAYVPSGPNCKVGFEYRVVWVIM